jgi:oligopeptide/dipeptide ABC transporter ATP-binding protein
VRGATVVMATSPSFNPQIVQAIQADLAAVGLEVEIHNTDQATHLKKVQAPAHDWGAVRFGRWSCSCLAADGVVYPLFHTGGIWSSYSNPAFDKLVEQARTVTRVRQHDKVASIGVLPSPLARPSGCAFSSRCPLATDRCHQETRALRVLTQGRSAAWHHAETAQVGAA